MVGGRRGLWAALGLDWRFLKLPLGECGEEWRGGCRSGRSGGQVTGRTGDRADGRQISGREDLTASGSLKFCEESQLARSVVILR
jgi:hypothetical protein